MALDPEILRIITVFISSSIGSWYHRAFDFLLVDISRAMLIYISDSVFWRACDIFNFNFI